jgi:hypothetical protein
MRGLLVAENSRGGAKETDESQEIYQRGKREVKGSSARGL